MEEQVCLNEKNFQEIEKDILKNVMSTSKSIIETFKFRMLFGIKVSSKDYKKAIKNLKDFRAANWDGNAKRDAAYKKYINLY